MSLVDKGWSELAPSLAPRSPTRVEIEDVVIDLDAYEVRRGGELVSLTRQEFELFSFLAQNRGRVFRRKDLLARVWGERSLVSQRTVDIHVYRLRAKLGPPFDRLIATVRRVGYKMCSEAHRANGAWVYDRSG